MAFNGSGTFARLYNWVTDKNSGRFITASRMDAEMDGFATGLSNCVTRDGQSPATANIPLGGHKITGLGDGTQATDAMAYGQWTGKTHLHLTKNGNQAVTSGALTKLTTWTADLDTLSEWSAGSHLWTAASSGIYLFANTVSWYSGASSEAPKFGWVRNGGVALDTLTPIGCALIGATSYGQHTTLGVASATAGDTFYLATLDVTSSCTVRGTYSHITIMRVG